MAQRLNVFIANRPGKIVSVPFKDNEAIGYLIERISIAVREDDPEIVRRELFINGTHLHDKAESINNYRIFGSCLTYLSQRKDDPTKSKLLAAEPLMTPIQKCIPSSPRDSEVDGNQKINKGIVAVAITVARHAPSIIGRMATTNVASAGLVATTAGAGALTCGAAVCGILALGSLVYVSINTMVPKNPSNGPYATLEASDSGPRGRKASPGTNVECKCKCTWRYQVICPRGFGRLDFPDARFECPNCGRDDSITPVTIGFMGCKYRFHVIKKTGEQHSSRWKNVLPQDHYQQLNPNYQTGWSSLTIESAPLNEPQDCSICLEPVDHVGFTELDCGHRFHADCFSMWRKCDCPNCRFNPCLVTSNQL